MPTVNTLQENEKGGMRMEKAREKHLRDAILHINEDNVVESYKKVLKASKNGDPEIKEELALLCGEIDGM